MFKFSDTLEKQKAKQLSPITLAFVGDAVYSLYIREKIVFNGDEKGNELNKKTSMIVRASAQADCVDKLLPILNEEEIEIYKRGRNVKKNTRAKHATVVQYNKSTGLEALIGYLYVTGQIERLNLLLNYGENYEN